MRLPHIRCTWRETYAWYALAAGVVLVFGIRTGNVLVTCLCELVIGFTWGFRMRPDVQLRWSISRQEARALYREAMRQREQQPAEPFRQQADHQLERYFCPLCGRGSPHLQDITHQYCTCCGGPGLPKMCRHDPDGSIQMGRLIYGEDLHHAS